MHTDEPAAARRLFGDRYERAARYAHLLVTTGVERGLLGPREVDRIWDRHLLNCAVVQELVPRDARVIDVGSGAGLPGVPLALARPDLQIVLVEPMTRRTTFLHECLRVLDLPRVEVVRARAEEVVGRLEADVVVARAFAPLRRLFDVLPPLATVGGTVLAVKGAQVRQELQEFGTIPDGDLFYLPPGLPVDAVELVRAGCGIIDPPATVVRGRVIRRAEGGHR